MALELNSLFCKNCNASLDPGTAVDNVVRCKYCGTAYILPKSSEPRVRAILDQGSHELDACRFEDAAASFAKAAELDKEEPEAYFGMALAKFRVQYLKDEVNNRIQPICHEISEKTFSADANYGKALRLASEAQKREYRQRALEIDEIRQEFSELRKSGVRYDCFLCVKVSAENGSHTPDYDRANDIYYYLRDKGYRPFFSEREIKGREGSDYEALILYALFTSECMLIVCSDEEYLQTKWVKNEYSRFYEMLSNEGKDRDAMSFAFYGRPIEKLPNGKKVQGIDLSKPDAYSRIADFVQRHTPEAKKQREEAQIKRVKEAEAQKKRVEEQEEQIAQLRRMLEDAERQRKEDAERRAREDEAARVREQAAQTEKEKAQRLREEAARREELDALKAQLEEVKRANSKRAEPTIEHPENLTPSQLLAMMRQAEEDEKKRKEEEERRAREEREKEEKRKAEEAKRKAAEEAARLKWERENAPTVENCDPSEFKIRARVLTKYTGNKSNVIIPAGVTEVGAEAFLNAPITSVKFPSSLTEIGDRAFKNTQLTEADLPEKVKKIGKEAFRDAPIASVKFPSSLTEIAESAFKNTQLTEVDLPEGLLKVGNRAFDNCTKLKIGRLPDSIAEIGIGAFSGCDLPKEFVLPVGIKEIGTEAFVGPKKIKKIMIKKDAGLIEFPGRYPHETFLSVGWEPDQVVVEAGNAYYFSPGGGLAEKKSGHLLFATAKTELPSDGSIKGIRRGAYTKVKGLTHLTIPGSVKNVAEEAICDCPDLEELVIENGVEEVHSGSVARCEKLKRVKIGEAVKFNYYASRSTFIRDCKNIKYETIEDPKLVAVHLKEKEEEKRRAAAESEKKRRLTAEEENRIFKRASVSGRICLIKYEGKNAGAVTVPDDVINITANVFLGRDQITEISLPASLKEIGWSAFSGCSALESINIPKGVETIADSAFANCSKLSDITIPGTVRSFGPGAFRGCSGLKSVTIKSGVTVIGREAFDGCSELASIEIPNSVATIEKFAFRGCDSLASVTIPARMTSIGELAFSESGLTGIEIPNTVTEIGASAFRDCRELKSVTIPDSVKSIDKYAFDGCPSLENVTIPKRFAGFMKSKLKSYFGDRWKQINYTFTD